MARIRLLLVGGIIAVGVLARPLHAAVDLTGDWYVKFEVGPQPATIIVPIEIVQTGTALSWIDPSSAETIFTGTIDTGTGAFMVTGGRCAGFVDTLTGTAALDSNGFTASGNLHHPEAFCATIPFSTTATGVRGVCGDGVTASFGETCDDGNTISGDCCSDACAAEISGSPCSDGNASTCEICDGAGTCQSSVCPSFDMSGTWLLPSPAFGQVLCWQFSQSGTGITATPCPGTPGAGPLIGTIDPVTREFYLTEGDEPCMPPFSGDYCRIDATAASDFASWTGSFYCSTLDNTPPIFCEGLGDSGTAARASCGDGFVTPSIGEQCDPGASLPTDCCADTCQYEPASTPCSGGAVACGTCNATGTCVAVACPFELDHYQCYSGKDLRMPPFVPQGAALSDQLGTEQIGADKLKYVCAPVNKNGEGIADPAQHLACYAISATKLAPRPQAQISSQFQASRFELKRARYLCLPATKVVLP